MIDPIDRHRAIRSLKQHLNETDVPDSYPGILKAIEEWLSDWYVPSLQIEPLTDKEQRIFLAAMGREEKVCKEVDEKYPNREPYEDTLVHVCKEIKRKVKGALWT